MVKKSVMGRGMSALIPKKPLKTDQSDEEKVFFYANINNLRPNPKQPRKNFDPEKIKELSRSIKEHGIIQPLIVHPEEKGYTIVAGERRFRAAMAAGLKEVPVIIKDLSPEELAEMAIIENVQREDLNSIEEALAYAHLIDHFGLTQGAIGLRIGKSRTAVTNALRLLKLPAEIQEAIKQNTLTAGHARAILALEEEALMLAFAEMIIKDQLSVRAAEKKVKAFQPKKTIKAPKKSDRYALEIQENLEKLLNARVQVKNRGKAGKIEIAYASIEELEQILKQLGYQSDQDGKRDLK